MTAALLLWLCLCLPGDTPFRLRLPYPPVPLIIPVEDGQVLPIRVRRDRTSPKTGDVLGIRRDSAEAGRTRPKTQNSRSILTSSGDSVRRRQNFSEDPVLLKVRTPGSSVRPGVRGSFCSSDERGSEG